MDQMNYDRREAKKHHNSNLAIWEKPAIDKYLESAEYLNKDNGIFAKEFDMLLEDLNKEGKELKEYKKFKEEYDKQMKAQYLASLKRVYRFKEFVDETNFNKIFSREDMELIEKEMEVFALAGLNKDHMLDKPRRLIKKKELKLEYKDYKLKTSSSEMEESSDDGEEDLKHGRQEGEFYQRMKTVKAEYARKITTFGEANVILMGDESAVNDETMPNSSILANSA